MNYNPAGSSVHGIPGKNTGVGCHFLLQGIFSAQGLAGRFFTTEPPGKPEFVPVFSNNYKASFFNIYLNAVQKSLEIGVKDKNAYVKSRTSKTYIYIRYVTYCTLLYKLKVNLNRSSVKDKVAYWLLNFQKKYLANSSSCHYTMTSYRHSVVPGI